MQTTPMRAACTEYLVPSQPAGGRNGTKLANRVYLVSFLPPVGGDLTNVE